MIFPALIIACSKFFHSEAPINSEESEDHLTPLRYAGDLFVRQAIILITGYWGQVLEYKIFQGRHKSDFSRPDPNICPQYGIPKIKASDLSPRWRDLRKIRVVIPSGYFI